MNIANTSDEEALCSTGNNIAQSSSSGGALPAAMILEKLKKAHLERIQRRKELKNEDSHNSDNWT